ncbi:hypothetical protein V1511DRAFT_487488 [Dipodascopsis uninucleata]
MANPRLFDIRWRSLPPADPVINSRKRAIVLVLGDIGRSPRMQYHVLSLVESGFKVDFCGYRETEPLLEITENADVIIHTIESETLAKCRFPSCTESYIANYRRCRSLRITQNPPSIPVFVVAWFFTHFMSRQTKFIIDWHNFGYTVLQMKLGSPSHILVKISKWYEQQMGRVAYAHFSVTKAMAEVLIRDFKISAYRIIPLHDRPAHQFKPITDKIKREVIAFYDVFKGFDILSDKIVITSTSYTPDEDLSVLLNALNKYDEMKSLTKWHKLPKLRVLVTGKGPLKKDFELAIAKASWKHVVVKTVWLSAEDYPKILATADLGVSLHSSTSGWDLPMKVVDMFGCGVPVLARNFEALPELVVHERNGMVFDDSEQLAEQLVDVFSFPKKLATLKKGALAESSYRWSESWRIRAGPLFNNVPNRQDYTEIDSSSSDDDI